ncbi:MAG: AAA family ATPase [Deltaproteobacteria bacterium]|nr:AAA family ATPase [Deltaproteobacteria bacterium]
MTCPECQTEAIRGCKFCGFCGVALVVTCSHCGIENRHENRFCGACGRPLTETSTGDALPLHMDSERRHVTVLFSDLSGYTAMTERLDPEEIRHIMNGIFEEITRVVAEYEGTIERFIGDAVMVLFGLPRARENHAVNAIHAARKIHERVAETGAKFTEATGRSFMMHSGINTGLVVTGETDPGKGMHGITGHAINLASRLQSLAGEGDILVGRETYLLAEDYFHFEQLKPVRVKKHESAILPYKVIGPSAKRTRFDVSVERGLTPLFGRREELRHLLQGYQSVKEGKGRAFSLISEAGVGKSRLVFEFKNAIANENAAIFEGKCISCGRDVAYGPVIEILRSSFDIREDDTDSDVRKAIERGLEKLSIDSYGLLPCLLELFSGRVCGLDAPPLSPEERKDRILRGVQDIFLGLSRARPLVVVMEDLHWADRSSDDAVHYLMEIVTRGKILLLFTYRPEFSGFRGRLPFPAEIRLNRLSSRENCLMASCLLETGALENDLERLILEKTEGIPLFVEEFIRSLKTLGLIDRKTEKTRLSSEPDRIAIPATIEEIIMARVDALSATARIVLQAGSAIEREFTYSLIRLVSGIPDDRLKDNLETLKDAELIYERMARPNPVFTFNHALTREVVYGTILNETRRKLHGVIGRAMIDLHGDGIEVHSGELAAHFMKSGAYEKAAIYFKSAGKRAQQAASFKEAVGHARSRIQCLEALNRTDAVGREIIDARTALAGYYVSLSRFSEAKAAVDPVVEEARRIGHGKAMAGIHTVYGLYSHWIKEDYEETFRHLNKAQRISEANGDSVSLWFVNFFLGIALSWNCRFEEGRDYFKTSMSLGEAGDNIVGCAFSKGNLGAFNYMFNGKVGPALDAGKEAVRISDELGDIYVKGMAYCSYGTAWYGRGRFDLAREYLRKGRDFCERTSMSAWNAWASGFLGHMYCDMGEYEKAQRSYESAVSIMEKGELLPSWLNHTRISLLRARVLGGDRTLKPDTLYECFKNIKLKAAEGWARRHIGEVLMNLNGGSLSEAEPWLLTAVETDRANSVNLSLGCDYYVLSKLYARMERFPEAGENMDRAAAVFKTCGAEGLAAKTKGLPKRTLTQE